MHVFVGIIAAVFLVALGACGGSSSETPPPLVPDLTRPAPKGSPTETSSSDAPGEWKVTVTGGEEIETIEPEAPSTWGGGRRPAEREMRRRPLIPEVPKQP